MWGFQEAFLCLLILGVAHGGRYLFYVPFVSKSMHITFMPMVEELSRRGHQVTVVMPFAMDESIPNVEAIVVENQMDKVTMEVSNLLLQNSTSMMPMQKMLWASLDANREALASPALQAHIQSRTKFDVVIVLAFIANESGYYLAHHFGADLVLYFSGQASLPWMDHALGMAPNPAFVPMIGMSCQHPMTFFQRVKNTVLTLALEHFVSLGMMNCRAGGELPTNLQEYLDDAKDGVIFVSFGSVVKTFQMTDERRETFNSVLGQRKEKILWKWETDVMPGQPANVKLGKWLPQQDILAHPNVKLFITHGGQSSFQESLCYQKPVIVIPVAGDQPANGQEAVRIGFGLSIPFTQVTTSNLEEAIEGVISDPKFTQKAQEYGSAMNDQITRPLERAVWWLEYKLRYPGPTLLRSPVHDLTWYQYYLLDVFAFLAAIILGASFLWLKLCLCMCRKKAVHGGGNPEGKKKTQ
eukprot:maker-scaffold28_size608977-snap-gene-1.14 protein:Tk05737 transcript:maker-scaffold28_size608977-snap-gene-1.14-mRNA-1 annotation:"udp-glucuronosyltransferase 2c1"